MRGKRTLPPPLCLLPRITPADAGKTSLQAIKACSAGDHPRGCGENLNKEFFQCVFLGSPPRMRGKRRDGTLLPASTGITPADAGKTTTEVQHEHSNQDHPRGCGENTVFMRCTVPTIGSPPRMRGKPADDMPSPEMQGITPADAGKTTSLVLFGNAI